MINPRITPKRNPQFVPELYRFAEWARRRVRFADDFETVASEPPALLKTRTAHIQGPGETPFTGSDIIHRLIIDYMDEAFGVSAIIKFLEKHIPSPVFIADSSVDDAKIIKLIKEGYFSAGIKNLDLSHSNITLVGFQVLLDYNVLCGLEILHLGMPDRSDQKNFFINRPQLGDEVVRMIADSSDFSDLLYLNLWGNDISFLGGEYLAKGKFLKKLKVLEVGSNPLGDLGVEYLAESRNLPSLEELSLAYTGVGDSAVMAIIGSSGLKKLNIWHNLISDRGAIAISHPEFVRRLTSLDLGSNQLSDAARKAIRSSLGLSVLSRI